MDNATISPHQNMGMLQTPPAASLYQPCSPKVTLENLAVWRAFHSIGTEMVLSKQGRRMFPSCNISLTGLQLDTIYIVMVDMVPADGYKYKWREDHWEAAGKAEPQPPHRTYRHPDSPAQGSYWMRKPLSFPKMKLTNNILDQNGHIVLHSLHRYMPRIHVIRADNVGFCYTFTFPETVFTTVTIYRNKKIPELKIDHNPLAKSFRGCRTKRSHTGKAVEERDSGSTSPENASPPGLQMMPSPSQLVQAENQASVQESSIGCPPGRLLEGHSPEHSHTKIAMLQDYSSEDQMVPLSTMPPIFSHDEFPTFPPGSSHMDGAHALGHHPLSSIENVMPQYGFQNKDVAHWDQYPNYYSWWSTLPS